VGEIDHTYAFHSIASDAAGNVESKGANVVDASVIVPDLAPPTTEVTNVDATTSTFLVQVQGSDVGSNGVVASFDLYVSIDGASAKNVTTIAGGSPTGGVYHAQTTYGAKTDGLAHTYRFFTRGKDGLGNIEAAPADPADVVVTGTFAAPHLAPLIGAGP